MNTKVILFLNIRAGIFIKNERVTRSQHINNQVDQWNRRTEYQYIYQNIFNPPSHSKGTENTLYNKFEERRLSVANGMGKLEKDVQKNETKSLLTCLKNQLKMC